MILDGQWVAEQWKAAMEQSEYFSLDRNTPEQAMRHWDMLSQDFDSALGGDVRRAELVAGMLADKGALDSDTVALDVGCGTGTFVMELAKTCRHVYALDYSAGMLAKLREKLERQGIENVTTLQCDWNKLDPADLQETITLSISCLNTGMRDRDSLVKMHGVTKGTCCYITSAGAARAKNRNELQELVFGRTLRNAGGGDVIYPLLILYAMGCYPELSYVPCSWRRTLREEDALSRMVRDFERYMPVGAETRAKLAAYVHGKLDDQGMYTESMQSRLGVVIWKTAAGN